MAYDYSRVTERLFVGAQVNDVADVIELKAAGVTHVIDANTDDERALFPVGNGIILLPDPTPDDGQPKPTAWFDGAIDFAIAALAQPGTIVLAHCAAGINRGPSLGFAIMRAQGFGHGQAKALICLARPQCLGGIRYRDDAERALLALRWTNKIEGI